MPLLGAGATLPEISFNVGESETITLPSDIATDYAIILFYRGHW